MRGMKLPLPPGIPNSFGSCVEAICSATPALNPTSTVSAMKLTITPSRSAQASPHAPATMIAVVAARAA